MGQLLLVVELGVRSVLVCLKLSMERSTNSEFSSRGLMRNVHSDLSNNHLLLQLVHKPKFSFGVHDLVKSYLHAVATVQ